MPAINRPVRRFVRIMYFIAGAAIVIMMGLTCIDVFLRFMVTLYAKLDWTFLEGVRPIPGTYELVALMASVAASFAMAHTSVEGGHVAVSIVTRLLPSRVARVISICTHLVSLAFFALLAWVSVGYAEQLQEIGEVSMTMQLPIHPFVYGLAFSSLAVCLVLALATWEDFTKVREQ
jgi:TRAP-type C4-dicarboxylate transport system permease small subunit